jgi:uncharacterized peroxidase-related enzyme
MTELARIEPATATGEVAELYDRTKKTIGAIPNMTTHMANSPAVLKAWLELSGTLSRGVLPAAVRERLALSTAEFNRCSYCLSAHTFMAKNVSKLDPAEVDRAREATSEDAHIDAVLKLSDAILRGRGSVAKTDIDDARNAGVTDAEITEIIANIALNVLTNYFNVFTHPENDFPELVTPRGQG